MLDISSLLRQLLNSGTIRIEIEVSLVDQKIISTSSGFLIKCSDCGWQNTYASEKIAARALRSHQAHCQKRTSEAIEVPEWWPGSSPDGDE